MLVSDFLVFSCQTRGLVQAMMNDQSLQLRHGWEWEACWMSEFLVLGMRISSQPGKPGFQTSLMSFRGAIQQPCSEFWHKSRVMKWKHWAKTDNSSTIFLTTIDKADNYKIVLIYIYIYYRYIQIDKEIIVLPQCLRACTNLTEVQWLVVEESIA